MSNFEKKRVEKDLRKFISNHFVKPSRCQNVGQIQYYVAELSNKIEELKRRSGYVPNYAYQLLSQYNSSQNSIIHQEFKRMYS